MSATRLRRRTALPSIVWIAVGAPLVFAAGVGVATLVGGVDATPQWMRAVAVGVGTGLVIMFVGAAGHWVLDRRSVRLIRRHITARRYRDAAVELQVYVKEVERVCGSYDPLTLRWTFTLAHLLLHTGQRMRALALLALVIDAQLTVLGANHPDTRRSLRLWELHTDDDAPVAPVEIWWRE